MDFSPETLIEIAASIIALLVAIIGHEIMHGYVAYRYGDKTAKRMGRLSLNPIVHIDPIGSIALPLLLYISGAPFLFGWAKPVPIDEQTVIRNGGYAAGMQVSLAGIAYNIFVAIVASIFYSSFEPDSAITAFLSIILIKLVIFNVVLAVLNAWIIPPLDGSNALGYLGLMMGTSKIAEFNAKIGQYGLIILIAIIATPLSVIFFEPARWILGFLL